MLLVRDVGAQFSQIESPDATVLECAGEFTALRALGDILAF